MLLGLFSVKETMFYSSYLCLKAVGLWRGFSEILRVRIYFVGLGGWGGLQYLIYNVSAVNCKNNLWITAESRASNVKKRGKLKDL